VTEKKTFERKHFFIDRKFQGRFMLAFLIPMLIMLVFMLVTLGSVSRSIFSTSVRIIKEDVENTVATQLMDRAEPTVEDYRVILDNIDAYLRSFSKNTKYRKALINSLLWVFGIGVFVVIIEMVFLTIYFSHKIAGPVYRLEKSCHAVLEGDFTTVIRLRRGDEMQNLAHLMNNVIEKGHDVIVRLRDEDDSESRKEIVDTLKL